MSSPVSGKPLVPPPPRVEPAKPFKALLEEVRRAQPTPPGLQRKPAVAAAPARPVAQARAAQPVAMAAAASAPAVARARVDAEARRLADARAHHGLTAEQAASTRAHHAVTAEQATSTRAHHLERGETSSTNRAVELIVKELVNEFETRAGGPASSKIGNPVQPISGLNELPFTVTQTPTPKPEVRAAQAAALIERIDVFVRSQRPALALTLNNSLGARVEIEKLGPGRIALRLVGQNGPPSADTVSRIREELKARGLTVGALSVG